MSKAVSQFKFAWKQNTTVVTDADRPVNELDRGPGQIDANSIETLANIAVGSPEYNTLKELLTGDEYKASKKGKPQRYSQMPKMKRIKIRLLLSALAFQRKVNFDHLMKIIYNWDSRRPAVINVIKHKDTGVLYITDGQHTALAIAIRAKMDMFPDIKPEDWLDIEVNCQVVETNDFSFAREHFLGINGDDKLPVVDYEDHKINVFGKRIDSPLDDTQEKYELANRKQDTFELYKMYPVHPDSEDRFKAGAFVPCNLIKKLLVDDIHFFGQNHLTYWPQENVDAMEILPFADLRKRLIKAGVDFDTQEFKDFMRDLNAVVKEVAGGWAEFKNLTQQVYPLYYEAANDDECAGIPKDASLALLLQLYVKAGGTFVTKATLGNLEAKYKEGQTEMFKHLSPAKRKLFK